jgi:hypothetical protein
MIDRVPFDSHGNSYNAAWFHEDDYCHIELLPKAAEAFARKQAADIDAFAEAHRAPGGMGWTQAYVQDAPPASVYDLKISVTSLAECVPQTLELFDRVTTGASSETLPANRTVAWGTDNFGLIFTDFDELHVVRNVWFNHFAAGEIEAMRAFLMACAARWHLILADWAWTQVVDLRNNEELETYLALRGRPRE